MIHQSDGSAFERNEDGFYAARCECGWEFGPLPDIETMVDALMGHVLEVATENDALLNEAARRENEMATVIADCWEMLHSSDDLSDRVLLARVTNRLSSAVSRVGE